MYDERSSGMNMVAVLAVLLMLAMVGFIAWRSGVLGASM